MKIYWQYSSAIELGIKNIDAQHKELMEKANHLNSQVDGRVLSEVTTDTARFLAQYVLDHFQEEEAFLREVNYPYYDEHKKLHDDFRVLIQERLNKLDQNTISFSDYYEISRMLNDWIMDHINRADRAMARYFKGI